MKKTTKTKNLVIPVKVLAADAKFPVKAHATDACYDLFALKTTRIVGHGFITVGTGVAFNIPVGYFGKIYERSGVSLQRPFAIKAGVIDAGYTGEINIIIHNHGFMPEIIDAGTKIAQIAIHELPETELIQVTEFENTERGEKGFGSSGT